jgi:hypothetical protein
LLHLDPMKQTKIDDTFPSTDRLQYWTTSEVRPDEGGVRKQWTVDFQRGGLGKVDLAGTAGVRCIKDR